MGAKEGLEIDEVEEGGAVRLGEGEVKKEHGFEEVVERDPSRWDVCVSLVYRWK